ncbi:hypothetical protein FACS189454_07950 [Planctomycetales bacterium]|nr:hypothetical protein FACS189454_07950 [Planctomycetales bacterium]
MRTLFGLILVSVFEIVCGGFVAAETYPYIGTVQNDAVDVLSGPGVDFYVTSQLRIGDKVEVFYEKDGYLAVRPPVGSFSWVSAKYVDIGANNLGTVLLNGLASRVGSDLSEDCDTVQVKLKRGESVMILGRRETPDNPVSPVWYKIAPPSGEFRWIPVFALNNNKATESPSSSIRLAHYEVEEQQLSPPINSSNTLIPPSLEHQIAAETAPKVASNVRPNIVSDLPATAPNALFQKAYKELEREVQIVMTRPVDDAVFDILIKRGNELYQIAPTDHDIEKTYHLVESLKRTQVVRKELALRRGQLPADTNTNQAAPSKSTASTPAPSLWSTGLLQRKPADTVSPQGVQSSNAQLNTQSLIAPSAGIPSVNNRYTNVQPIGVNPNINTVSTPINTASQFDITGRLGEFEPLPKGYPPFAVVDEKEQIICLVSPIAGLDLEKFVGKNVGINGQLGFYERPNKPRAKHITVENIKEIAK